MQADGVKTFETMQKIVEAWARLGDEQIVAEGPPLYEQLKQVKDELVRLSQVYQTDMAPAVAAWRQLNQEMPRKINALRVRAKAKE